MNYSNYILRLKIFFYNIFVWHYIQLCKILPVTKRKIVFSNFNGKGYGDNPKYIAEEIIRQKLDYKLVWLVGDMNEDVPNDIRKVLFNRLKARYELLTAKVIINNVKNCLPYKKKRNQYYIQTWHGCFPLKYIEAEVENQLNPGYVASSKLESTQINLLLAGCSIDEEIMSHSFWYSGEIFKKGIPRNDVLFMKDKERIVKVRDSLKISEGIKVALYAPTFRDKTNNCIYKLDAKSVRDALEERTGEHWAVIIRLHPNVSRLANQFQYSINIINGTNYPDSQELEVASDILITDYSSMIYDFAIMGKPVFLFAEDIDTYKKERGLRPIYFELPYPLCFNNNQLCNAIREYDYNLSHKKVQRFMQTKLKSYDDGHASEAVVHRIRDVIEGKF